MISSTRSSGSMLGAQDVDTVQEVQILTANFNAEYGRSSGGQIRFVERERSETRHADSSPMVWIRARSEGQRPSRKRIRFALSLTSGLSCSRRASRMKLCRSFAAD